MPVASIARRAAPLAVLGLLVVGVGPAAAATPGHVFLTEGGIWSTITSPITSVFHAIGSAALGAFTWTISLATKFILVTLSALVRMLIPRSWARDGVQVFQWIAAVPNYAGTVTSPGGGHAYGFAGINDMRELFQWIGVGLLPLTLVYATGRAMIGEGEHVAAPVARVVMLALLLLSYTYWWGQGAALINQLTDLILSPAPVVDGIYKLMAYATEGVALGGWQLIDLALMAALAIELLGLIFLKVVIILIGALLFATGPLMLGLVPTDGGSTLARAWLSAVITLLILPVAWSAVFAIGAVLIGDASTAGPLIGGNSSVGTLLGGVIVAVAGAATLWLCLKAAREAGGLLRIQLGGLLVAAGQSRRRSASPGIPTGDTRAGQAAQSIRGFQRRIRETARASTVAAGPAGAAAASAVDAAGRVGRRGLIIGGGQAAGTVTSAGVRAVGNSALGTAARPRLAAAAASAAVAAGPSSPRAGRAGAVASRMARAGKGSWQRSSLTTGERNSSSSEVPRVSPQTASSNTQTPLGEPRLPKSRNSLPGGSVPVRNGPATPELAGRFAGTSQRGNASQKDAAAGGSRPARTSTPPPIQSDLAAPHVKPARSDRPAGRRDRRRAAAPQPTIRPHPAEGMASPRLHPGPPSRTDDPRPENGRS